MQKSVKILLFVIFGVGILGIVIYFILNQFPFTPSTDLPPTETVIMPTLEQPFEGMDFPTEQISYPNDWPAELIFPDQYVLVEFLSTQFPETSNLIYSMKFRFEKEPQDAFGETTDYLEAKNFEIYEASEYDDGSYIIIFENTNALSGFLFIDKSSDMDNSSFIVITASIEE